ncbi:extracellular proline-serine rich protein [Colletotrichum cuscutae]|uniref:Extracellular proline-serine rich protein n=1 Tax=Colletotrichum cuscutae TaxID=1209917 RepID=A0AAI9YC47_9PEZI|nr:extracellular proline-serine rich protein [Colletotrichum cuscutae]
MRYFSVALALAAPLVSAIEFTSPSANSTVAKGKSYELSWNTVDTDPSTFSVFLVNFVNWPPSYVLLAQDLETAAGSASIDVPCSTLNSDGYQFNAINGTNVYVIYAQTPKFSVTGSDCTDPTTLPPASPSACAPPSTVTVTVSKTLSKNSTATATGGFSAAQSSFITTTAAVPATTPDAPVFHGTCPDTIGWASDYHHPVTLTKPPHHPEATGAPYPTGSFTAKHNEEVTTIYRTTYLPLELAPTGACKC